MMHDMCAYVLLPDDDLELRAQIVGARELLLSQVRDEYGKEIKAVHFVSLVERG